MEDNLHRYSESWLSIRPWIVAVTVQAVVLQSWSQQRIDHRSIHQARSRPRPNLVRQASLAGRAKIALSRWLYCVVRLGWRQRQGGDVG